MMNSEVIFLMGSQKVRDFEGRWEQDKSNFQVSNHKYGPNYSNYLVAKNNSLARYLNSL